LRSFTDLDALIGMVPSQVVTQLSAVDFGRGSEALYRDQMPGLLTELADRARVLSITASSAIQGVIVADADRAQRIIDRRTTRLRNRSEQELAGYRDAQDYLFREDWRTLNAGLILHLHRLLFAHTAMPGGVFKTEDNLNARCQRPDDPACSGAAEGRRQGPSRRNRPIRDLDADDEHRTPSELAGFGAHQLWPCQATLAAIADVSTALTSSKLASALNSTRRCFHRRPGTRSSISERTASSAG
jgi:hypothetical protein